MKVLIACEESQRVCIAFRERGHEAYSCDIQDCSGGHPEWHIKGDALEAMIADFERLPIEFSERLVPVTRCKDCKYSCCISDSRYCAHCNYPFSDCEVDDNFYCAYGARKDGDSDG